MRHFTDITDYVWNFVLEIFSYTRQFSKCIFKLSLKFQEALVFILFVSVTGEEVRRGGLSHFIVERLRWNVPVNLIMTEKEFKEERRYLPSGSFQVKHIDFHTYSLKYSFLYCNKIHILARRRYADTIDNRKLVIIKTYKMFTMHYALASFLLLW